MITLRITANIKDDRRVLLTLPPEVPTGQAELVVTVEKSVSATERGCTGSAEWVEERFDRNGDGSSRYLLRGTVVSYVRPTEPASRWIESTREWRATDD